jgi:hypothetical protein
MRAVAKGIPWMQLCQRSSSLSAGFDNPNLVSTGGLVPVLALAKRAGLRRLTDEYLTVPTDKGAHAGSKVGALVAGMNAGADSIEDMNPLRHGGMAGLFAGTYAPSTRTADVVARIHCRWVAGTNYGAICPTNPSHLEESVGIVACVEAAEEIQRIGDSCCRGPRPDDSDQRCVTQVQWEGADVTPRAWCDQPVSANVADGRLR